MSFAAEWAKWSNAQSVTAVSTFGAKAGLSAYGQPRPVYNFQPDQFLGTWFEVIHNEGVSKEQGDGLCITAEYSGNADGSIAVKNSFQKGEFVKKGNQRIVTGDLTDRMGVPAVARCQTPWGACFVEFFGQGSETPNYNVIGTDYENWAITYDPTRKTGEELVWVLSRTPQLPKEFVPVVFKTLQEKLPNFNPALWDTLTYQGKECDYAGQGFIYSNRNDAPWLRAKLMALFLY